VIYLPSTGKNLKPWKEPQVATYSPLEAEWGEMMKSEEVVKASLLSVRFSSQAKRCQPGRWLLTSKFGVSSSPSPRLRVHTTDSGTR
jgi:hypothetical protein